MEPCSPEAREAALQVLYRRIPDSLRSRLVVEVLQEASCGQVDLSGLWVARDRCPGLGTARFRIIGTLLTQALAGRAAAIWAPEVLPSWRRATTAAALCAQPWQTFRRGGSASSRPFLMSRPAAAARST